MVSNNLHFAFTVAPVGEAGMSDAQLYAEVLADSKLGQSLGYDSAWMLEHHFSDYSRRRARCCSWPTSPRNAPASASAPRCW